MRLIIVSNRLPITVTNTCGNLELKQSGGGLATAINSYISSQRQTQINSKFLWIGWPGQIPNDHKINLSLKSKLQDKLTEFNLSPVFLTKKEVDKYYFGFCNQVIWPLFHGLPKLVSYSKDYWQNYIKVNQKFYKKITDEARPGDIVWIHDYHLMLLPKLIKKHRPDLTVGFFMHIPFPSFKLLRHLPKKILQEILVSLSMSDVLGFHIPKYKQNFLQATKGMVDLAKIGTYPISINFQRFTNAVKLVSVQEKKAVLRKQWGAKKILLSLDRLDYTKGVANRLKGFEQFLNQYPKWRHRVKLVLLVVPSREEIPEYRQTKLAIEQLVEKINRKFGTSKWQPVLYEYKSVSFHTLVAYYMASDVMLVTPLSDGMNLIAKEFIASRLDKKGVLILSEKAGSASELTKALLVNPLKISEIKEAINQALLMPVKEQVSRNLSMQKHLQKYDVFRWAQLMLGDLYDVKLKNSDLAKWLLMDAQTTLKFLAVSPNLFLLNSIRLKALRFVNNLYKTWRVID